MQTLSDLAKTIQEKTSERAKSTEQIVQSELARLENSLQQRLSESERSMSNAIASHEQGLKEKINKTLAYKTAIGGITGFLVAMLATLAIANLYLYRNIDQAQAQLADIQQNIEQTPLQAQALAKVTITQNNDKSIWITANNPKKSEAGKLESNGKPSLKLEQ